MHSEAVAVGFAVVAVQSAAAVVPVDAASKFLADFAIAFHAQSVSPALKYDVSVSPGCRDGSRSMGVASVQYAAAVDSFGAGSILAGPAPLAFPVESAAPAALCFAPGMGLEDPDAEPGVFECFAEGAAFPVPSLYRA